MLGLVGVPQMARILLIAWITQPVAGVIIKDQ